MNLWSESLWRDEAYTALLIRHDPVVIVRLLTGDTTPPLYYLALHYWSLLFGDSEVALRGLSVLFFLGTAWVMYRLGEHLKSGLGIWLLGLTLTQPLLFRYAFEARSYSLLALLMALAIYFYLKKSYRALTLTMIALLYTHLFAFWILLILLSWSFYKSQSWRWAVLPAVLILPWLLVYWNVSKITGVYLSHPDLVDLGKKLGGLGVAAAAILLPYLKKLWVKEEFRLLTFLWIVPISGTWLFSQVRSLFLERYLILIVPPLIASLGLIFNQKFSKLLLTVVLATQLALSAYIFTTPNKADFQGLSTYLKENRRPGDVVLNSSGLTFFESQYYRVPGKILSPSGTVPYYIGAALIDSADTVTSPPLAPRYWLIELKESGGELNREFPARKVSENSFYGLKLSLYEAH